MTPEIIELVIIGCLLVLLALKEITNARERRDLYSRLQAGSLTDYTTQRIRQRPPARATSTPPAESEPETERSEPPEGYEELPTEAVVSARTAQAHLMGESP